MSKYLPKYPKNHVPTTDGHPCYKCKHFLNCAEEQVTCDLFDDWAKEWGPAVSRKCHDCGKHLPYHEWVEVRCTLDQEDVTQAYCYSCLKDRIRIWLRDQDTRTAKAYFNGKPHYRAFGNSPTDKFPVSLSMEEKVELEQTQELFPPENDAEYQFRLMYEKLHPDMFWVLKSSSAKSRLRELKLKRIR